MARAMSEAWLTGISARRTMAMSITASATRMGRMSQAILPRKAETMSSTTTSGCSRSWATWIQAMSAPRCTGKLPP